jgi:hypothetical protein
VACALASVALVVAQVALSLILLIGAALMGQTIVRLTHVDLGFPSAGLWTMRVPLPVTTYDTAEKRARFFDALVTRVRAIPDVSGAAIVRALPTTGGLGTNLQIESQPIDDPGRVGPVVHTVVPGYFEVVGQRVLHGRPFEARDSASGAPGVVIVNDAFARKYWSSYPANRAPVGDRLTIPVVSNTPLEIVAPDPRAREVLWIGLGQGLRATTIGLLCGIAGAYASTRLLASLLFGVSATDALTFAVVPAVFVVVTVLASLIPAWRATRIGPAGALRV